MMTIPLISVPVILLGILYCLFPFKKSIFFVTFLSAVCGIAFFILNNTLDVLYNRTTFSVGGTKVFFLDEDLRYMSAPRPASYTLALVL